MIQEEKDLLLKDFCARLPYGVKVHAKYTDLGETIELDGTVVTIDNTGVVGIEVMYDIGSTWTYLQIDDVKPYLFPLSSMTKEQEDEWYEAFIDPLSKRLDRHTRQEDLQLQADAQSFGIEYLLKNHFDIYGLIPMRLGIDATNLNIY